MKQRELREWCQHDRRSLQLWAELYMYIFEIRFVSQLSAILLSSSGRFPSEDKSIAEIKGIQRIEEGSIHVPFHKS